MTSGLLSDAAEEAQGLGMVWLHRKDLAVERLGARQPAGLVVVNR